MGRATRWTTRCRTGARHPWRSSPWSPTQAENAEPVGWGSPVSRLLGPRTQPGPPWPREQLVVEGPERLRHLLDGEVLDGVLACEPAERLPSDRIGHLAQGVGQSGDVVLGDEDPGLLVLHGLGHAADPRRHHGQAGKHGLHDRERETLRSRRQAEDVPLGEAAAWVRIPTGELHPITDPEPAGLLLERPPLTALPEHDEPRARDRRHGRQQHVVAFDPVEPAEAADDEPLLAALLAAVAGGPGPGEFRHVRDEVG